MCLSYLVDVSNYLVDLIGGRVNVIWLTFLVDLIGGSSTITSVYLIR